MRVVNSNNPPPTPHGHPLPRLAQTLTQINYVVPYRRQHALMIQHELTMARQRGQEIRIHPSSSRRPRVAFPTLLLLVLSFTYFLWLSAWVRTTPYRDSSTSRNTITFQSNIRFTSNSTVVIPDSVQNDKLTNNTASLISWQGLQHHLPISASPKCIQQSNAVDNFCQAYLKNNPCQVHTPELIPPATAITQIKPSCKTLWFAGFSEGQLSQCPVVGNGTKTGGTGIRMMYAAALQSAKVYADGVLQPVLMLGRCEGVKDGAVALRTWALAQGAIVVRVNRLSFHNDIATWHRALIITSPDHQMGPYMRLDIPNMIENHRLFDLPNICQRHILYTDADTLFVNPVSHIDMDALKSYMLDRKSPSSPVPWWWQRLWMRYSYEPPIVMYGREHGIGNKEPKNTGVMLMDAPRFQNELPAMVKFRNEHDNPLLFTAFDQNWLNMYFRQNARRLAGFHLLPLYWNWKIYWSLEPSAFPDLKVVHFHGPKPMLGAWLMADCEFNLTDFPIVPYHSFVRTSICCDRGKTAARIRDFYNSISPKEEDVC